MVRVLRLAFVATTALLGATFAAQTRAQEAVAAPRENVMKACGDKWRTVREAETQKGVTWPQFLASCRAQLAGAAGSSPNAAAKAESAKPESETIARERTRTAARSNSGPVFPQDVATKHSSERPALARQRTCADQFKANKTSDANGGLKWIEKGGGYWSKCNAHLKQLRA